MHRLDPFGIIDEVFVPVSTVVQSISKRSPSKSSQNWPNTSVTKYPYVPRSLMFFVIRVFLVLFIVLSRLLFFVRCFGSFACPCSWSRRSACSRFLLTGTGTGGRTNATNSGFFPRLGVRAERISRLTFLACMPEIASSRQSLSLLLIFSFSDCRVLPCLAWYGPCGDSRPFRFFVPFPSQLHLGMIFNVRASTLRVCRELRPTWLHREIVGEHKRLLRGFDVFGFGRDLAINLGALVCALVPYLHLVPLAVLRCLLSLMGHGHCLR